MMRRIASICAATCFTLTLALSNAWAQSAPDGASTRRATETARWRVYHLDERLGVIIGDAAVDWQNAEAVVTFQYGGKDYRLDSTLVLPPQEGNPGAKFVLSGNIPVASITPPLDTTGAQRLPTGDEAVIKASGEEDHFAFGMPSVPDDRTITVELAVDDDGDMSGRWNYAADPMTQRAARGDGSVGRFSMAPDGSFGGKQSGSAMWLRLDPEIADAVVVEDQLHIPQLVAGDQDPNADTRTLFIVGRNLPILTKRAGFSVNLGTMTASIGDEPRYVYIGTSGDSVLNAKHQAELKRGWSEVLRRAGAKDAASRRAILSLECALIEVRLRPGFVPGMRELTWAGAKIPWRLESAGARAQVSFVRNVAGPGIEPRWETATEAYFPEDDLAIEVRLPVAIPYEGFKLELQRFLPGAGKDKSAKATGTNWEMDAAPAGPQIYRVPFSLSAAAAISGSNFDLQHGELVEVHANPTSGLLSFAAAAQLPVTSSPGRNAPLWSEYLLRAARSDGLEPGDARSFETQVETKLSKTIVFLLDRIHTDIRYGDHAAMLLLRDAFIARMQQVDKALADAMWSRDTTLGLGKVWSALLDDNPQSVLRDLPASRLNGVPLTLAQAFNVDLAATFGDDTEARDLWLSGAIGVAVQTYRDRIEQSVAIVKGIADDDIEKLLKITGKRFDPVVADVLPRLMRFDDRSQRWVVDQVARSIVSGIGTKYDQLRTAEDVAKIDNIALYIAIQIAISIPTAGTGSVIGHFIKAAGNGVMWLASSAATVYEKLKGDESVAFAFGASAVLGDTQFREAELADPSWASTLTMLGVESAFSGYQVLGDLRAAQAALQIGRGARVAERSLYSLYGISKLAQNEQRDLIAFLAHARAASKLGKPLTNIEMAAVRDFENLAKLAAADPGGTTKALAMAGRVTEAQRAVTTLLEGSLASNAKKELIASLRLRQGIAADLWRAAEQDVRALSKVSEFDLGWMSGRIIEPDEGRALALAEAHNLDWHELKDAFQAGKISGAEMHNFVSHRENFITKLLDESTKEVADAIEKETGIRPVLKKKALGSTNLTSDLDYSVYGEGAERVVKVFNQRFREIARFKGLESGHVFDTNVYTQAVYELYSRNELIGKSLGIANADLDSLRQLMYESMATRKYIGSAEAWKAHTSALLAAVPDTATRKMIAATFDEADYAYRAARSALGMSEAELAATEGNALLAANNRAYEQVLDDIGQWRLQRTRLQQLQRGELTILSTPAMPETFAGRYPGWVEGWNELVRLQAAGKRAEFDDMAKTWLDRLAFQLRRKQGQALFYASEAYQDEATILHVVNDLQKTGRAKDITFAKLSGGIGSRVSTELARNDGRGALNSMMENLANLRKELGHAGSGPKAAAKGGKYFIRVLDAGHEAGIDVVQILGPDIVRQTIGVDALRANIDKVGIFLQESGTTPEGYINALTAAHERLGIEMVKHKDIAALAGRVSTLFDDFPSAAEAAAKTAAIEPLR